MPLELLLERQKVRAAFWRDQVLALAVRTSVDIFQHLTDGALLHIVQVAFLLLLLVARKIFKVTYCLSQPTIKVSSIFHEKFGIFLSIGKFIVWIKF